MTSDTLVTPGRPQAASAGSPLPAVKIWDLPTRVFHWLLALSFAGAYLTSESDAYGAVHVMFGYTLAGLIGFRLVWGLVGTRYARFGAFLFGPAKVAEYLKSLLTTSPKHYLGHNPAGAIAIFALLALGLLTAATGFATYRDMGGEWLEELHEGVAAAMLTVVAIHVLGVAVSSVLHRENLVRAMISGNKPGRAGEGIPKGRPLVGALLLAAVLGYWTADLAGWIPGDAPAGQEAGHRHHDHHH